ncbi:choice-of-anchor D domain-containing protein [Maribacter sp. 2-571]|uniref:choice-of-anchor D domain-containing protein n=1 Tax=Maribacter sp. 2-571 TaxID=3417569 RepID=UPI003D34FD7A
MKTKITLLFLFCCTVFLQAQVQVTEGTAVNNNPDMIGCNNNTTLIEEPWDNPNRVASLKKSRLGNLRYPGGTVSENWDYRNDTFFPAKGTPGSEDGWVDPSKMIGFVKSIIENGNGKVNSIENFAKAQEANGLAPVYVLNMTTPGLDYYAEKFGVPEDSPTFDPLQPDWWRAFEDRLARNLEMLRRAEANGMPVRYLELSNELYFGAGEYQFKNFQGFRADNAGFGYPEACHYFITEIEKEFPEAKFSAVAFFNTDGSSGRRKNFWNGYVIPRLDRNLVDALTMHAYIESDPNQTATTQPELNAMLNSFRTVFDQAKVNTDFDALVTQQNWDVWWTEYMPNFFKIGPGVNQERFKWENALVVNYNIASYLELASSEILEMHEFNGMITTDGGLKAVGRAISLASLAVSGMTERSQLSFSGTSNLAGTDVPELFGFSFSDQNNKNFWITNASGESKTLDISGLGFSGKVMHQAAGTLGSEADPTETVTLPDGTIVLPPNSITTLLTTDLPDIQITTSAGEVLENGALFDFGTVRLGNNGVENDFEVTNLGGGTLNLSDVSISGPQAADFEVTQTPNANLVNRERGQLTIRFAPLADGDRTATITIANNDPDEAPFTFTVKGKTSRAFAFNRLDVVVVQDGFKDIRFRDEDAGVQGSGLRLTSLGRVNNDDNSDGFTIWRVRNASEENKEVVLRSVDSSFEYPFTIKKNKEAFIRSPYVTGSATHTLFFDGNGLTTKSASNNQYADGRTVFVAKNGNVGGASPSGRVRSSNGIFTMEASGSGISGTSDQFRYIFERIEGDFEFTTKLSTVPGTGMFGIMVRKNNGSTRENVFLGLSEASELVLQRRFQRDAATEAMASVSAAAPIWLRIQRSGNIFTASYATDGLNFTVLERTVVVLPFKVSVGLAGSSGVNGQLATAVFDEAVIVPEASERQGDLAFIDTDTKTLINDSSFDFGLVELNASETRPLRLINIGTRSLQINAISIAGADASLFTLDSSFSGALSPGQVAQLDLTFTASQSSSRSAELIIESNDADTPITELLLTGQGPGNLLGNGDFEAASRAPWINAGTVVDDATNSRSGNKALRIFIPDDAPEGNRFLGAVQSVAVQPLGQYTVQGYYKGVLTSPTGAARILVRVYDAGNNVIQETSTNFFRDVQLYKLMTASFAVPQNGTRVEVIPQILAATGNIWFDDIEMADNTNNEPASILRNGSFDSAQKTPWTNGGTVQTDVVKPDGTESNILRLFLANKGFGGARQQVKVTPGSTYNLSGSVKRSLTEGFARFFVQYVAADGSYVTGADGKNITKATPFGRFGGVDLDYKFIGLNGIIPPAEAIAMEINLQLFNGQGSVWWEDIRLEEILPENTATLRADVPLEETSTESLFAIYPNPTANILMVSFAKDTSDLESAKSGRHIQIYDMGGRIVLDQATGNAVSSEKEVQLSVQNLNQGLYVVKVLFADGSSEEKLLQIQ